MYSHVGEHCKSICKPILKPMGYKMQEILDICRTLYVWEHWYISAQKWFQVWSQYVICLSGAQKKKHVWSWNFRMSFSSELFSDLNSRFQQALQFIRAFRCLRSTFYHVSQFVTCFMSEVYIPKCLSGLKLRFSDVCQLIRVFRSEISISWCL